MLRAPRGTAARFLRSEPGSGDEFFFGGALAGLVVREADAGVLAVLDRRPAFRPAECPVWDMAAATCRALAGARSVAEERPAHDAGGAGREQSPPVLPNRLLDCPECGDDELGAAGAVAGDVCPTCRGVGHVLACAGRTGLGCRADALGESWRHLACGGLGYRPALRENAPAYDLSLYVDRDNVEPPERRSVFGASSLGHAYMLAAEFERRGRPDTAARWYAIAERDEAEWLDALRRRIARDRGREED